MSDNPALVADENLPEHDASSRCGAALQQERVRQSMTVQDIATKLRLSQKQIEALEADNFSVLPESAIVRGFIRNYAKLLKIEAEPLLRAYTAIVPSKTPMAFTVKPSTNMKVTSYQKPKLGRYFGLGLLILAGLGAWLFYQNYIQKPTPAATSENVLEPAIDDTGVAEPLLEPALPAAEREVPSELSMPPADATKLADETKPAAETISNAPAKPVAIPMPAPATKLPSTGANGLTLTPDSTLNSAAVNQDMDSVAGGVTTLEFDASQETWVSIVDASGKEVYNKTIFAGSRERVDVKTPVNVVVGNALGVRLDADGKPIDLAPHMRGNVARVKLK